jgi:hypothetical protein
MKVTLYQALEAYRFVTCRGSHFCTVGPWMVMSLCRPLHPPTPWGFLALISVRGWVYRRVLMLLEGLGQLIIINEQSIQNLPGCSMWLKKWRCSVPPPLDISVRIIWISEDSGSHLMMQVVPALNCRIYFMMQVTPTLCKIWAFHGGDYE